MTPLFDKAFAVIVGHEAGYSNDHGDNGNWTGGKVGAGEFKGTKYGISAASYLALDIVNLQLEDAKAIYFRDYWLPLNADMLPPAIALVAFDGAVNASVKQAAMWLQAALNVAQDGVIGRQTLNAVRMVRDVEPVIVEMLALRNEHNRKAQTADRHGLGWSRRLFKLSYQAIFF